MRSVVVTGGNKGIGLAIVQAILEEQADVFVYLGSRDAARGEDALRGLVAAHPEWEKRARVLPLDVQDDESVEAAARSLAGTRLHGIVNNAGIARGPRREVLDVNVLGVERVCTRLLPLVEQGGRIVNVTSAAGPSWLAAQPEDVKRFLLDANGTWSELRAFVEKQSTIAADESATYGLSKACANLYTLLLARAHPELQVNACTPGFIETDLTRGFLSPGQNASDAGMKPPAAGARAPLFLLFGAVEGTGRYYGSDAKRSPLDAYRAPGAPAYEGP